MLKNIALCLSILFVFSFLVISCKEEKDPNMFTLLDKDDTGINFRNILKENENFNIFKYQYYYNGGGVAVADFDNDGLQDIFFTGNMVKNRLFKNKGNFKFEDVTEASNVAKAEGWCTGANAIDINNDGYMDIYVCRAGYPFEKLRSNLLLINNKNMTFTDKAAEYGLNDNAYGTHSAFFDYDRDNDLDLFLLNHSAPEYSKGGLDVFGLKDKREPNLESKLFRNDNGKFNNVSEESGIKGNVLSLSLGLGVIDINNDGWSDIFIGNDFNESDYLYMNNGDGTFTEKSKLTFDHTSMFSMGCDIADINNDGHMDLISLDMLPESNYLQKLHSGADNYSKITAMIHKGFQPQFSKNVLQINNGDGSFSECAQMYGVSNTDWSWSALFMDFDQDSYQDLFISNGYLRDHTDMDFLQFTADQVVKAEKGENPVTFEEYMASMPPIKQPNYFYLNNNCKYFMNKNTAWNLTTPSVTGASAYADFDNDGDLDLVCSNVGDYAFLYKNNSPKGTNNYLNIQLKGSRKNINGIGARLFIYAENKRYVRDLQPSRGFQSSNENKVFLGLGKSNKVDSIYVSWPNGLFQKFSNIEINKTITLDYNEKQCKPYSPEIKIKNNYVDTNIFPKHEFKAKEFDDLKIQGLLPFYLTDRGPKSVVGDFNNDHLEDVIITGNSLSPTKVYLQKNDGSFTIKEINIKGKEISDLAIIPNKTGKINDIVFCVGSYAYQEGDKEVGLYFFKNDGNGEFKQSSFLPTPQTNGACLVSFKSDNKNHLIVGGCPWFGAYPVSTSLSHYVEDGNSSYTLIESIKDAGMINDVISTDINEDKKIEVITAGDFTPIKVYNLKDEKLQDISKLFFEKEERGLWKKLLCVDHDGDGKKELFVGNLGENSQLKANDTFPLQLYYHDYDKNGSYDPILAHYILDDIYPFAPREDMIKQVPMLNKRFQSFGLYAKANVKQLLGEAYLKEAKPLEVNTLQSCVFIYEGNKFKKKPLPDCVQVAPLYAISKSQNGNLLLGGNQTKVRIKLGQLSGNHGIALSKNLQQISNAGFKTPYNVRDIAYVKTNTGYLTIFCNYDGQTQCYIEK